MGTHEDEPELEPAAGEEEERPVELPLLEEGDDDGTGEEDEGTEAAEEEEEDTPGTWPTLEEYKAKWDGLLAQHSRPVPGDFSRDNLVPEPIPQLWQNCPHVPFSKLESDDAQSRLSRCRPVSGFKPPHTEDGVVRYSHNTCEANFRRMAPLQLASTLGFI